MARGFQSQEGRHESPGGATGGGAKGEGLEKFDENGVFGLGRVVTGRGLLPGRKRPAAQPQGEDAQSRRKLDPSGLDRHRPRRETQEHEPQDEAERRRRQFPRQNAEPGGMRLGEAHQSPERQCEEKARRQAETPRSERRLT
jgi:hypothetical protein